MKEKGTLQDRYNYNKQWRESNKDHQRLYNLWNNCRYRAKKGGFECTITIDDIKIPDKCPILNIDLIQGFDTGRDNSPSVDRIHLDRGYTPDNIQIISVKANRMKNNATLEQLVLLGKWAENQIKVYNAGGNADVEVW